MKKKFVLALIISCITITGCSVHKTNETLSETTSKKIEKQTTEAEVTLSASEKTKLERIGWVADTSPFNGETLRIGFDNFFSEPKWDYFEANDGALVIQFTGICYVDNALTDVKIQYVLSEDLTQYNFHLMQYGTNVQNYNAYYLLLCSVFNQNPEFETTKEAADVTIPPTTESYIFDNETTTEYFPPDSEPTDYVPIPTIAETNPVIPETNKNINFSSAYSTTLIEGDYLYPIEGTGTVNSTEYNIICEFLGTISSNYPEDRVKRLEFTVYDSNGKKVSSKSIAISVQCDGKTNLYIHTFEINNNEYTSPFRFEIK